MFLFAEGALRKKWKYLRDQFSVEFSKIPINRSRDEGDGPCVSKWPYFKSLLFLRDIVRARASSGNCTNQKLEIDGVIKAESEICDGGQAEEVETEDEESIRDNQGSVNINAASETLLTPGQKRKRDTSSWSDRMLRIEEQKLEYLLEKKSKKMDASERMLYFLKSLMPHIEKIPENRELAFRRRVEWLVDEFAYDIKLPESPTVLQVAGVTNEDEYNNPVNL